MKHVFGPVASRRLGYSLGVEVIPSKTCTFNCIYCQVGHTTDHVDKREEYVPTQEILDELSQVLPQKGLHYVTFSGSGEPTLHSKLGKIIDHIKSLTDTPVCVITNSSLIWRKDVQRDLKKADVVIPSLDSAVEETYRKINRPVRSIKVDKIINGLIKFRKNYTGQLWLEMLFVKGLNDSMDEVAKLKEAAEKIKPDKLHLNTVVRPPASPKALAVNTADMNRIAAALGEVAVIIRSFDKTARTTPDTNMDEEIYELIRRRGVSLNDLVTTFGIQRDMAGEILQRLVDEGKIQKKVHAGVAFYLEKFH